MYVGDDQVRLCFFFAFSFSVPEEQLTLTWYAFILRKQRRRAGKSLRVPLLQSQAQGSKGRAGHGDTAGAVPGAVDGGGLFALLMGGIG